MNILVADDESLIRLGLKSMLLEMGHEAILARDGQDAMKKAMTHNPDLAILDIQMPRTNGLQLAKALNKHAPMPIIFLTAFSQDELIEQATDLNVQGYLIKPVQSAELKAAIHIAYKRFHDQLKTVAAREKAETRLTQQKLIDRAKAKLISQGMSEEKAHKHIQALSRSSNTSMAEISEQILEKR